MTASLDTANGKVGIGFDRGGCEESDQVVNKFEAEFQNDGSLVVNLAYRNGDEAILTARYDASSTAC
jgi:hypothetical protein